jgi:hypothetical protein
MPNCDPTDVLPVTLSIADAKKFSGLSRSELYRQLAAGTIHAVKLRSRTLILMDCLRQFLASLPTATFRKPRGR